MRELGDHFGPVSSIQQVFSPHDINCRLQLAKGSRERGQTALHMVSASVYGREIILERRKTTELSNEVTAVPELIQALVNKGADWYKYPRIKSVVMVEATR